MDITVIDARNEVANRLSALPWYKDMTDDEKNVLYNRNCTAVMRDMGLIIDGFDWMRLYDPDREHDARHVQYYRLEEWAKDHNIEFKVDAYGSGRDTDEYWLYVTEHHGDGMCHGTIIKYPNKIDMHDRSYSLKPWTMYGNIPEFVALFDMVTKACPIQETWPLGAVA